MIDLENIKNKIIPDYPLKSLNTFGINVQAKYFSEIKEYSDLKYLIDNNYLKENKFLFLGGGSNVLFINDFDGIVIKNNLTGIEYIDDIVSVKSGNNWHQLVLNSLDHNLYGLENLSLIPGSVGACPIQNIGAYGQEVKNLITKVKAVDLLKNIEIEFSNDDCQFGYRDSIFKKPENKNRYLITEVDFKLSKVPNVNFEYGAIKNILRSLNIDHPSPNDISNAVIQIRSSKLPDPKIIGNAGSFFKNPEIPKSYFQSLILDFPQLPHYIVNDDFVKIPAGYLIEYCGFKGFRQGDAGCHNQQALVLVNYGNASGQDILDLAYSIIAKVKDVFDITLTPEVNIIN